MNKRTLSYYYPELKNNSALSVGVSFAQLPPNAELKEDGTITPRNEHPITQVEVYQASHYRIRPSCTKAVSKPFGVNKIKL